MKLFKQIMVAAGLFALFVNFSANAANNAILRGIDISSPDNENYKIVIKTDKDVPIKKYITAENKVVLELEGTQPAQFVNTRYENATGVDHVIVQSFGGNRLRIFLQGDNITAGKIILDTRDESLNLIDNPQENQEQTKPVVMDLTNKAVDKVKDVTPLDTYQEVSDNNLKTVQNSMQTNNNSFDWILRIIMIGVIIIAVAKMLIKPKKVQVALSSEIDLKKELLTKSLGLPGTARRPINASTSQYGLKEYQNSQLPPKKLTQAYPQRLERPIMKSNVQPTKTTKQPVSTVKVSKQQTQQAKQNFDGTKFLETMAAIYQKSGREESWRRDQAKPP